MSSPLVLIVPGLRGSGPAHWQSLWQAAHPEYVRVLQDWDMPHLGRWTANLDAAIRAAQRPVILAAHSFGCLAVIRRLAEHNEDVAGALLVAPADPQRFHLEAHFPAQPLGVPAYLVASADDPWLDYDQAARLAKRFDCTLVNAGAAGHLNAESGYGPWPKGERLLRRLQHGYEKNERAVQVALAIGS